MRKLGLALIVVAGCGGSRRPASYRPPDPPRPWCRVGAGAYAYLWAPSTEPALIGDGCATMRDEGRPPADRSGRSTLAELVVPAGAEITFPVVLPPTLARMGCVLDSVAIAHGTSGDLELEVRARGAQRYVAGYDLVPPAPSDAASVVTVTDRPSAPPPPAPPTPPQPPPRELTLGIALGGWEAGVTLQIDAAHPAPDQTATIASVGPVRPLQFTALRHRLEIPAPDSFTIVLRARTRSFGVAVRSARESRDPSMTYRAPGANQSVPIQLIPQAAVVVTRCRQAADHVLDAIKRY